MSSIPDYNSFNKVFEELRVKISHPKAMCILRNVKKNDKKNFIEQAILNFYGDVRNGKKFSNSIDLEIIKNIENEEPTPLDGRDNNEVVTQLLSILASGVVPALNIQPSTYVQEGKESAKNENIYSDEDEGDEIDF